MSPIARCEHCGHQFEVDSALAGGHSNCPNCARATAIDGLRDPLWRALQFAGFVVWVAAIYVALRWQGPLVAIVVGGLGAGALWLLSRGL